VTDHRRGPTRRERDDAKIGNAGIFANTQPALILARMREETKLGHVRVTERGWLCTCGVASTLAAPDNDPGRLLRRYILAAFVRRHRDCVV
jgi:hypothetical protein